MKKKEKIVQVKLSGVKMSISIRIVKAYVSRCHPRLAGRVERSQAAALGSGWGHENGAVLKEHVLGVAGLLALPQFHCIFL